MMYSLKGVIGNMLMRFFRLFPLQNKVFFCSFDGNGYNDSPRAVFEYMRESKYPYKFIWALYDDTVEIDGARVVKAYSIKMLYHMATSKVWVFSSRQREWMLKRNNQLYIQTWHGGIALKKIEKDIEDKLPAYYVREAKHDSNIADLFLSASSWNSTNIRDSFWYNGPIVECGLPRSDLYYNYTNSILCNQRDQLGLTNNNKVVLYAPTFRDDGDLSFIIDDFERILNTLKEKWDNDWVLIAKLHPNLTKNKDAMRALETGNIIIANHCDLNHLLLISDFLITDYSSCMFDALELGLNAILYTPDYEEFCINRNMYFNIDELPFPRSNTIDDLCITINDFDETLYRDKAHSFLNEIGLYNDGNASSKVVQIITTYIDKNERVF